VRLNHAFAPDGRYAACLAADPVSGDLVVESWTFTGPGARPVPLPTGTPEGVNSQLVPLGPGTVLVARQRPGAHELAHLSIVDGVVRARRLAGSASPEFRVLPRAGRAAPVVAATTEADGSTTLHRVEPRTGRLRRLSRVDWPLRSGVWLDQAGRLLGTTRVTDGRGWPVVVDVIDGTVRRLPAGQAYLLLASPASGLLLLCRAEGPAQLLYAGPDGAPRHPPTALSAIEGAVLPLAFDPAGLRVALRVRRGARCRLLVHDAAADSVRELAVPAGEIGAAGAWASAGLRFPYSSPTCPSGLATLSTVDPGRWELAGAGAAVAWRPAQLEVFPGPAGDIEAVVYGDWRTAADVAVVLHGGPDTAWGLDFQPLFQAIAGTGTAVVAPNPRGSTGYGAAFRDAIRGRWGGPDLADVLRVGAAVVAGRGPGAARPALLGGSYGGFLALLAAARAPALWSRCAAAAPFLSVRRLYEQAGPVTRALVDRLGGRGPAETDPDLLELGPRIRVPLLLIHGECDDLVPVGQSRALADRLRAAGRRDGVDFGYVEVPGGGHFTLRPGAEPEPSPAGPSAPVAPAPVAPVALDAAVVRFLRTGDLSPFRCQPHRENAASDQGRR
jgi:alpha-beta hydrolase superfamily lysophospholipase